MFKKFAEIRERKDVLRGTAFEDEPTQSTPVVHTVGVVAKVPDGRSRRLESVKTQQRVLDYLVAHEGESLTLDQIAEGTDIHPSYVSVLVHKLMDKHSIRRVGRRGSYRYPVRVRRVNRHRVSNTTKKTVTKPTIPKPAVTPEVRTRVGKASKKVLQYLTRHEDQLLTHAEIARGSGVHVATVHRNIARFEKNGTIVRSAPTYKGTRYWLSKEGPNLQPTVADTNTLDSQLHAVIDGLVWQFMKECKQTDILVFLEWLQKRK